MRRVTDDVGLELQSSTFDRHPDSSLFNPTRAPFAEARRVHVQWIYSALFEGCLRVNWNHQPKLLKSRCSQGRHCIETLHGPFLHQQFAADEARRSASVSVVTHEAADLVLLTQYGVR